MFWLIAFIIFICVLYFGLTTFLNGNDDFWPKQGIPLAEGKELGTFWERITFKIPFHEMDKTFYRKFKQLKPLPKLGGIMEFRRPIALLLDPELIKNIMVKDFDHFTNRLLFGKKGDPTLFDKMLFSMHNPEWKHLRATLSPTFTTGKIKRMFSIFTDSAHKLTTFLKSEISQNSEIDFRDAAGRYTMDVIASAAFGVDSQNFNDKNSTFAQMGLLVQKQFTGYFGLFKIFLSIMLPGFYALLPFSVLNKTAFHFFQDVVLKTIKHRGTTGEKRNDFLQLLMETRSESSNTVAEDPENTTEAPQQKAVKLTLTDELIVAQCTLFFFAGFDTTETLLVFAAYELALNPDVQNKLSKELKSAVKKHGVLNYEIVNELEYLDMVISETLRKYPPVSKTVRQCTEDYNVPDTKIKIKKDQVVTVPVWAIHQDSELYPNPEKFIPERFTKENKAARNPYTYMPFGVGPRNCIAMRFALTEGKTAIAHLVQNFVLEPSAKTPIPMKYEMGATMKPAGGMWLKFTSR